MKDARPLKIIAQTFYRHTSFLTHDAQVADLELGLYPSATPISRRFVNKVSIEPFCAMVNVHQQALQRGKIRASFVLAYQHTCVHCHMSVEIIVCTQLLYICRSNARSVQSQGAFECVEFIVHSQRGRREHCRVRALEHRLVHRFATLISSASSFPRRDLLATQSGRIGIRFPEPRPR